MKKTILSLGIALLVSSSLFAQKIEVAGFYGYMLSGKIKTYYGDYNVSDNPSYGGMLSFKVQEDVYAELSYTRNDTDFKYYSYWINNNDKVGISVEYYQLGVVRQVDMDKIKPFGTFSLGMTRLHVKETVDFDDSGLHNVDDAYVFSATIGAGVKIFLTDKVGLRLQARMLLPMEFNGIFISGGTGGASGGASFRVPIIQGDFTAGFIIAL